MKKTILVSLCLALVSAACLSTMGAGEVAKVSEASEMYKVSKVLVTVTVEATLTPSPSPKRERGVNTCAVVMAERAQNLRDSASANGRIILHLMNGGVVQVIDKSDPDWWRVSLNNREGFARSSYLKITECVK